MESFEDEIKNTLLQMPVLHADELRSTLECHKKIKENEKTGVRQSGKQHWIILQNMQLAFEEKSFLPNLAE